MTSSRHAYVGGVIDLDQWIRLDKFCEPSAFGPSRPLTPRLPNGPSRANAAVAGELHLRQRLAEGLSAESYLDTGNRTYLSNSCVALVLHPEFHVNAGLKCWEADACAPLGVSPTAVERDNATQWRWTDGSARLPIAATSGRRMLEVHVGKFAMHPLHETIQTNCVA